MGHSRRHLVIMALLAAVETARTGADVVVLEPVRDNTVIEPHPELPDDPLTSNALGPIFAGRSGALAGFTVRRAVILFDPSPIPAGATVECVTLTLQLEQTNSGDQTHTLHRLLDSWGEGTSYDFGGNGSDATLGDATWAHRFFPVAFWATPGGDFVPEVSASAVVPLALGPVTWGPSNGLVDDVQAWVDGADNHGWIMIGNEQDTFTNKRFTSKDWPDPAMRPKLRVLYTAPGTCVTDVDGDGVIAFGDLLAVLAGWGPTDGCDATDVDRDGDVAFSDLLAVLAAWGPCAP